MPRKNAKEYQKKYYEEHKEQHLEKTKKWAQEHREKMADYMNKYRNSVPPGESTGKPWTEEDIDILIANPEATHKELAKILGRTISAVAMKRQAIANPNRAIPWRNKNDIQKQNSEESTKRYMKSVDPGHRHYLRWSDREIEFALDPSYTAKEAAEELGRTIGSVYNLRNKHKKGIV